MLRTCTCVEDAEPHIGDKSYLVQCCLLYISTRYVRPHNFRACVVVPTRGQNCSRRGRSAAVEHVAQVVKLYHMYTGHGDVTGGV